MLVIEIKGEVYVWSQLQGVRHHQVPKAKQWLGSFFNLTLRLGRLQGTSHGQMLGGPVLTDEIKH